MPLAVLHSRALTGVRATPVSVEVHTSGGLPHVVIVGLPDTEVRESRDRVRSAIVNNRFFYPRGRVTINLAPANLPKEGGRYDLPIALGILIASGQLPGMDIDKYEFSGELALNGELRSCGGALPITLAAAADNRTCVLSPKDASVGALSRASVLSAHSLSEVCAHLTGHQILPAASPVATADSPKAPCISEVKGQTQAKRALQIAAAGGHSLIMVGAPGSGKSMLAARFVGLMPLLTEEEALEAAAVRSLSNQPWDVAHWRQRPYQSPHHTASAVALVGGGGKPRPGEISLAHNGVLFLDELPEFSRHVLEALREPLEIGSVTISRAAYRSEYPASFQLVAAMNPCPCGYSGHPQKACRCTPTQISRYRAKISGPLIDRIDIHLEVPSLTEEELLNAGDGVKSEEIREGVVAARDFQQARQGILNAQLTAVGVDRYCVPEERARTMMRRTISHLGLSARAYHRILKVARTIADMAGEEEIGGRHLAEAVQFRRPIFSNAAGE